MVVDYFSTRHQFFIDVYLRRTHDLSQSASANLLHQVRLDAISFARERLCDPQSIILFVRASAPQCHRCRSHQPSYGCEYLEALSRCFSAKGRGLLTCHTRTMECVMIRSALRLFCGAWPVQSPCLVFFFAVCGDVSTLLVSLFCVSILRGRGERIVVDRVNQVPFERSGHVFFHVPVTSVFCLVGRCFFFFKVVMQSVLRVLSHDRLASSFRQ